MIAAARTHGGFSTCSELLSGRWTESLITEHLGEPDYTVRSPANGCVRVVRFYRNERVIAAEESDAWQQAAQAAQARCGGRGGNRGENPVNQTHRACDAVSATSNFRSNV